MMGKQSREKFQLKLNALRSMSHEEWKRELAATIDSLKEIQKQKNSGAKVLTPGLLHDLRIYKRKILNLLGGENDE